MARHVSSFHLDLAQLWWCTTQDFIDHIRQKHSVPSYVKAANLGHWFPPWTVTGQVWRETLKPQVSGVSTDVLLFSESGLSLMHHYWVFGAVHGSLHGTFMGKLMLLTVRLLPKPGGRAVVYRSGILRCQRYRIHCVAFDRRIQTMNSHYVRPVRRYPRLCRKCHLVPRLQRSSRPLCRMPGWLCSADTTTILVSLR